MYACAECYNLIPSNNYFDETYKDIKDEEIVVAKFGVARVPYLQTKPPTSTQDFIPKIVGTYGCSCTWMVPQMS